MTASSDNQPIQPNLSIPWFGARKLARKLAAENQDLRSQRDSARKQLERLGARPMMDHADQSPLTYSLVSIDDIEAALPAHYRSGRTPWLIGDVLRRKFSGVRFDKATHRLSGPGRQRLPVLWAINAYGAAHGADGIYWEKDADGRKLKAHSGADRVPIYEAEHAQDSRLPTGDDGVF